MEENILIEEVKKSEYNATNFIDYKKLEIEHIHFIPCKIEEEREELIFTYDMTNVKKWEELVKEDAKDQLQFLINFGMLERVIIQYKIDLSMENVFYNDNFFPLIKKRDIYGKEETVDLEKFLFHYKCFAGGLLQKKYNVKNLQESGLEVLKKEKGLASIYQTKTRAEVIELLQKRKEVVVAYKRKSEISINKANYSRNKIISRISLVILVLAVLYTGYQAFVISPELKALILANQSYIKRDYVTCIEVLEEVELENMDKETKYILAIAYTRGETFKKDEIENILAKLSPTGDEKLLEYWILIGRMDFEEAQDLAISLSDDKLLIYAYMKEAYLVEIDGTITGAEKRERLNKLEQEIAALGRKYEQETESLTELVETEGETESMEVTPAETVKLDTGE